MSEQTLDEPTLVARAQDGDAEAFEQLVFRYEGRIFRYAYQMMGNRQEAEDIVQETLIRVWRALPGLSAPEAFKRWTYQIASRLCLNVLQREARRSTASFAPEDMPEPDTVGDSAITRAPEDPVERTEAAQQMEAMAEMVAQLSPSLRACWVMRDVDELSYADIARILSVPEPTVRGRIARARAQLAKGMSPWR